MTEDYLTKIEREILKVLAKTKIEETKTKDAIKFRQEHTLDSSGTFYKYVPKKKK